MNQAHRAVGKRRATENPAVSGPRSTFDGGRVAQRRAAEAGRVGDRRLRRVPVGYFLVVLGLAGLSSAWLRANQVWGAPEWIARVLFWLAFALVALVALLYAGKWLRHPAAARAELARPGALPLVAGPTTSVLVLAAAGADTVSGPARALWWVGALAHLVITVWVTDAFFVRAASAHERSAPVWLLPAVGALAMPLAARAVGSVELAWVGFGAGVVLWLGLWPSLASRAWAEPAGPGVPGGLGDPTGPNGGGDPAGPAGPAGQAVPNGPDGDLTTRALFVAAPATAMWAWQSLTGGVDDPVGRVLLAATLLFLFLVFARLRRLLGAAFALTTWVYVFAASAAAVAAITMAGARPDSGYDVLASFLLTLASVATVVVGWLTVRALARRRLLDVA